MKKPKTEKLANEKLDWRKRPRKAAANKRTATVGIRVTPSERVALNTAALEAGKTLVDYILTRCCDPTRRESAQ